MNEIERIPVDSDLLRTFVCIAGCGNLTIAAGHLARTQSAISVQLRKLETGLGATLFDRTPKGMVLTTAGEKLLPRAQSILSDLREASGLFSDPLTGSIRVGLPDDFDEAVLERVLNRFSRAHPRVRVIAISGCTSGYGTAIAQGALDIAVCSGPDNITGDELGFEETVWAAKAGLKIDRNKPAPLAVLDRSCWWRDVPTNALRSIDRDYDVVFRSSSFASLLAAIRSGYAIGVLPASSLSENVVQLRSSDGFPKLARSRRSILIAAQGSNVLTQAMGDAIREARAHHQSAKTTAVFTDRR